MISDVAKQKVTQACLTQMVGCDFALKNTVLVRIVPRAICGQYRPR